MKKLLLFAALMCIASVGYSQVGVGLKGGLNFANQNFETDGLDISPDGRTGFHFGAYLNISLGDKFGLQPEALFSQKGSEFEIAGFTSESNFNYVDIPVLVRYNITDIFSLHAGPQVSVLLSAEDEDGTDIEDNITGSEFALAFGAQVDLPLGLIGGARYNLGLSDINDVDSGGTEVKNRVFQLYVGWKLFGN